MAITAGNLRQFVVMAAVAAAVGCSAADPETNNIGSTSSALGDDGGSDAAADAHADGGGTPTPDLGTFVLYATQGIKFNSGVTVNGCNIGVQGTSGPGYPGKGRPCISMAPRRSTM